MCIARFGFNYHPRLLDYFLHSDVFLHSPLFIEPDFQLVLKIIDIFFGEGEVQVFILSLVQEIPGAT